jgi:hypothetical protein
VTSLPFGYSVLLGLTPAGLTQGQGVLQVQGQAPTWECRDAIAATIVGLPNEPFSVLPIFVPGSQMVLWGRRDVLANWDLGLYEKKQYFVLQRA